jgi:hypothetical protein
VNPIQTHFGVWEVLLLQMPDVLGAVSQKHRALIAVTSLDRFILEPCKQLGMAGKGCDEALVDRTFETIGGALERVEGGDHGQLGIFALLAFGAPRLGMLSVALATMMATRRGSLSFRQTAPLVLGLADHRRAAPIRFDHQNLTVIGRSRGLLKKWPSLGSSGVDRSCRQIASRVLGRR